MVEIKDKESLYGGAPGVVFTCSGAEDVGEIADRAGRELSAEGAGRLSCLAGIGVKAREMIQTARSASVILAIDGCKSDCAKKTLKKAGFKKIKHIRVTDLDMEKGKSRATKVRVRKVVSKARKKLAS